MIGGGPEGGIFKTTNAGKNWTKLTRGLPTGDVGRAGLAIDPRKTSTVFALVDAKRPESGFFRSDDSGNTWTRIGRHDADGRPRRPRRRAGLAARTVQAAQRARQPPDAPGSALAPGAARR